MIVAFFIVDALRVAVVTGEATGGENRIRLLWSEAEHDECSWGRIGIAAEPFRVGGSDGLRQAVDAAQDLNGAVLAVIGGGDAEMGLLIRGNESRMEATVRTNWFQPISSRRSPLFLSAKSRSGPLEAMGTTMAQRYAPPRATQAK